MWSVANNNIDTVPNLSSMTHHLQGKISSKMRTMI